jgi:hypothetical protein
MPAANLGRPPKNPEDRADHYVYVCLTERELAAVDAARGDESRSAFVRRLIAGLMAEGNDDTGRAD